MSKASLRSKLDHWVLDVSDGEENTIRGRSGLRGCVRGEFECLGECKDGLIIHYTTEPVVNCIVEGAIVSEEITKKSRCAGLMTCFLRKVSFRPAIFWQIRTYSWRCEPQGPPLGLIAMFSVSLLDATFDCPCFERFPVAQLGMLKGPLDVTSSVPADPLTIDVNVYLNVKVTRSMDGKVRSWNRLAESGSRCHWRQEGEDELDRLAIGIGRRYVVGQVRDRCIVLGTDIGGKGKGIIVGVRSECIMRPSEQRVDSAGVGDTDTRQDTKANLELVSKVNQASDRN